MNLSEDFQDVLDEYGEPVSYAKPSVDELNRWSGKIPETLIDFWRLYGWTSFLKGQLWLPDPADFTPLMETVFGNDPQIDHTRCHLVAYSAFGKLFIWSEQFQRITIQTIHGWVFASAITDDLYADDADKIATFAFYGDVKTDYNSVDEAGKPLYARAVKKYGSLEPGECFGFVPALVLGGSGNLEEIQRVKALEHFIFLAQLQPLTLYKWEGTTMVPVRQIGSS